MATISGSEENTILEAPFAHGGQRATRSRLAALGYARARLALAVISTDALTRKALIVSAARSIGADHHA